MKTTKYVCDMCGREENFLVTRRIPLLTDTDWAKSTAAKVKPHIVFDDYELCDNCLLKVTNVIVHFRGDKPKIIHECDKGEL